MKPSTPREQPQRREMTVVDLVKMMSYRKGDGQTYRPEAGTRCLFSGPHMDDENGYVYHEVEVLWRDDLFVVYRVDGCWPNVHKWEHVRAKPIPSQETGSEHGPASEQRGEVVAAEAPNAAAAKAVQPDGPAIDVVSAIHRHAKELARLTETWPADSAPPPPDVQAWQPIETAPMDGADMLLAKYVGHTDHSTALWWVVKGSWSLKWKKWWDGIEPSGLAGPTHWMPLPSPPQAKGADHGA